MFRIYAVALLLILSVFILSACNADSGSFDASGGSVSQPSHFIAKLMLGLDEDIAVFGWSVVAFTVILKLVLSPLDIWQKVVSRRNAKAMERMRPQLEALAKAYEGKIHLFEFGDTLPGGVEALDAAGHTPGHTAYRVGKLLIVGDLMHGVALQIEHNEYCANFDMDKAKAVDARRRILALAADGNMLTAGMHFPVPGFIQFEKGSPESL